MARGDGSYMPPDMYDFPEKAMSMFWQALKDRDAKAAREALQKWRTLSFLDARAAKSKEEAKKVYREAPGGSLAQSLAFSKLKSFVRRKKKQP